MSIYTTIDRFVRIVRYLRERPWSTVRQMIKDLEIPEASAWRMLRVMVDLDLVEKKNLTPVNGRWQKAYRFKGIR